MQIIDRQTLGNWSADETKTFTIPKEKLSHDRLSLFIIPIGQEVTINLKMDFDTAGGPDAGIPLDQAQGGVGTADQAFIFTTEDVYPGDLVVEVVAGNPAPTRVELVAVVLR